MAKIDVLLATYNGQLYIEQQILSLLAQTYKDWHLYVRDDGSADDTMRIVMHYANIDDRITIVKDSLGGLGCIKNFLTLLTYSKSPYIIFCDQDDIWLENKLEILIQEIEIKNNEIPQLVYCNAYRYTTDGVEGVEIRPYVYDLNSFLFRVGGLQGSSSLFNSKLRAFALQYKGKITMHDFLTAYLAALLGEITYIDRPLMLYRQHEKNVTGNRNSSYGNLIKRCIYDWNNRGIINVISYNLIKDIACQFNEYIPQRQLAILKEFLDFPQKNRIKMIGVVLKNRFTLYGSVIPIILKILFFKKWCSKISWI